MRARDGYDRGVPPPPVCDIPSGCCSFTGPWTVTRSSLRVLRRVAAFCRRVLLPPPPHIVTKRYDIRHKKVLWSPWDVTIFSEPAISHYGPLYIS